MGRSAHHLGYDFGLTSQKMNVLLADHGYLEGAPGDWKVTEKGAPYANERYYDNGYGGWAARDWTVRTWSDDLSDALRADIQANPDGVRADKPPIEAITVGELPVELADNHEDQQGRRNHLVAAAIVIGVAAVAAPFIKPLWQKKVQPTVEKVRSRFRSKPEEELASQATAVGPLEPDEVL